MMSSGERGRFGLGLGYIYLFILVKDKDLSRVLNE